MLQKRLRERRELMSEVKFSKEHEWITLEEDVATIGITKHLSLIHI